MVADGARDDLARKLLADGRLPNLQKHIVDRGCYRSALTVFPSTTGPAHIPFVCGIHPGTANVPGYRWLDRALHDRKRRSIYRHRSLNSPRGLLVGRDMDPDKSLSLYQYFEKPSSVLELIDYCPNQPLYKVIARRLYRIVQAHKSDDWSRVDGMVERLIIQRLRAGSKCIIGSFFGIDEYSHLYSPFDDRTEAAYEFIDGAVGRIAGVLKAEGIYDETIMAIVSDHGLSDTHTHIPLVDITREAGFDPYCYPRIYRRRFDSAVLESGNACAQIYFKRGDKWGPHWNYDELRADQRTAKLIDTLVHREGTTFVAARLSDKGVVFVGPEGSLSATERGGKLTVTAQGKHPLAEHPTGEFTREELFRLTYDHTYPDAINQLLLLFAASRSGDIAISSEPGYDLRLQYESPEHHGSHGSLHREHMKVPLMLSVPLIDEQVANYDIVPTILRLCGKKPDRPTDGRLLPVRGHPLEPADDATLEGPVAPQKGGLTTIIITVSIIVMGIVLTAIFNNDIVAVGNYLLTHYGQDWMDGVLFLITAISSTPLALPIWAYALVGIHLGYTVLRLAIVMALGSATGSMVTFWLGRYFSNTKWVKRHFPNIHDHPWTKGRSRTYVTWLLFIGTASPIPCDVFYVACGAKKYPTWLFWVTMVAARFVRYVYLGYGFKYFGDLFDKWM